MERNFSTIAIASLFFVAVLLGGYSCSDDDPYYGDYLTEAQVRKMIEDALRENNKEFEFTNWKIVNITVENNDKNKDWSWNEESKRFEVVYDLPELNEDIYKIGAVLGFIFIGPKDVNETQKTLPYVHTYGIYDNEGELLETYTETISFDVQYKKDNEIKPSVAFFIQALDLFGSEDDIQYLEEEFNFRLVMIW